MAITTPVATIFTKIDLYSRPLHGSSRAYTPPCPETPNTRCQSAARRERDPRPRAGGDEGGWGGDPEVGPRAPGAAGRPWRSGRRARVPHPRPGTSPYPNPGPPPAPPPHPAAHRGARGANPGSVCVHLCVGAFLLTLAPLGARQECEGRRGVKYIYIHLYTLVNAKSFSPFPLGANLFQRRELCLENQLHLFTEINGVLPQVRQGRLHRRCGWGGKGWGGDAE